MLDVVDATDGYDCVEGPLKRVQRGQSGQDDEPEPQEDVDFFNEVVDGKDALKCIPGRRRDKAVKGGKLVKFRRATFLHKTVLDGMTIQGQLWQIYAPFEDKLRFEDGSGSKSGQGTQPGIFASRQFLTIV